MTYLLNSPGCGFATSPYFTILTILVVQATMFNFTHCVFIYFHSKI